jgi:hypothetical protein
MALDIQAVAQAQEAKFILTELAGKETACLVAELCDAFAHQRFVDCVIPVHRATIRAAQPSRQLPECMSLDPLVLAETVIGSAEGIRS